MTPPLLTYAMLSMRRLISSRSSLLSSYSSLLPFLPPKSVVAALSAFDCYISSRATEKNCDFVVCVIRMQVGLFLWLMNMYNPYEWAGRYSIGLADHHHAELFNLAGSLWFAFTAMQWQGVYSCRKTACYSHKTAPRSDAGYMSLI